MTAVYSIATGEPFLETLAREILNGFPGDHREPPTDLARTRILLPTRRAARELEKIFFELSGGPGLLLPRITPIGDIDEELFEHPSPADAITDVALPDAISPIGRDLILIDLIGEWARNNQQAKLAGEILASPQHALALARSLTDFIDGLETEEISAGGIAGLFGLESARHREAILDFLALAREKLPARLHARGLIGPVARRSLLLRSEAARLAENPPPWPIIAAGSTGSIPATRELLKAIASLPHGAVVLPGLDTEMDDASWDAVGAQHPQYALKQLLSHLSMVREQVTAIPPGPQNPRSWLASEIMRPTETSDAWSTVIRDNASLLDHALDGVELVEARHVHEEAKAIALILRHALETSEATASLVTPDRDLARRVKQELKAFAIDIDDSAGEPLIRFGGAALLGQTIDAALAGFSAEALVALLKQDLCNFGMEPNLARYAVAIFEAATLRVGRVAFDPCNLADAVQAARAALAAESHPHPVIANLTEDDWQSAMDYAAKASACIQLLPVAERRDFRIYLERLVNCCETAAGGNFWSAEGGEALRILLDQIRDEAASLDACDFSHAATVIRHYLGAEAYRSARQPHARLSILGLLEARLARPDCIVLGGLNEGRWPALPDSGPWLNRPMRERLGLQQPERQIGQTAHDFAQSLGCKQVILVWSRRVDDAPAIPSRWILRLQMLMKAAGLKDRLGTQSMWPALAARLDEPATVVPCGRPRPAPPRDARPKRLSVTRIETLIRDPYAIYAGEVLGLRALDDISERPDMALRGIIFHQAIGDFLKAHPDRLPANSLEILIEHGRRCFAPYLADADIATFWWRQFERIAAWFIAEEKNQRTNIDRICAETGGKLELNIAGESFALTCRTDRVDILTSGHARIVDYKTGAVPSGKQVASGLAPQLTLQAAMLERGAFTHIGALQTDALAYVKLAVGEPAGEVKHLKLEPSAMECSRANLAGAIGLLTAYADPQRPYLPRTIVETEDEERDFDHLSRFREWALSGNGP